MNMNMNILNNSDGEDPDPSTGNDGSPTAFAGDDADDVGSNSDGGDDEARDGVGPVGGGHRPTSYFMEGYTPLNMDMNSLVGTDGGGDDGDSRGDGDRPDEGIMDGDPFASAGYYHMMGAPPRRLNGVKHGAIGFLMHRGDGGDDDASSHLVDGDGGGDDRPGDAHDDGEEDARSPSGSVGVPDDFHLLAEQALRGLEVEHSSILGRSAAGVDAPAIADARGRNKISIGDSAGAKFEAQFPPSFEENDNDVDAKAAGEAKESYDAVAAEETAASSRKSDAAAIPKIRINDRPATSTAKPMDVGAIREAMRSIRLKSPSLARNLDEGASSSLSADAALAAVLDSTSRTIERRLAAAASSPIHPIVPAGPLAAFRRNTPRARAASVGLTRSGTLSEAVARLWPLIRHRRRRTGSTAAAGSRTLTIHVLGADGVECASEESARRAVGPFARWMDAALRSGTLGERPRDGLVDGKAGAGKTAFRGSTDIDSLLIEFSGPNMPDALIGRVLDLSTRSNPRSDNGLASARATFRRGEYHEASSRGGANGAHVDLAVAFNAGVWGYDSWKPTIADMLCRPARPSTARDGDATDVGGAADRDPAGGGTVFVITAYTVEECEDDAEVVAEVAGEAAAGGGSSSAGGDAGPIARQLWAPEPNPFSSRSERKTASAPAGRKYYENGAWQAWLLG